MSPLNPLSVAPCSAPELLEAEGDPDLPRQLPQLDLDLALLVVDVRPQELGRLEDLAALGSNAAL